MTKLIRLSMSAGLALSMVGCATLPINLANRPLATTPSTQAAANHASLRLHLTASRAVQELNGMRVKVKVESFGDSYPYGIQVVDQGSTSTSSGEGSNSGTEPSTSGSYNNPTPPPVLRTTEAMADASGDVSFEGLPAGYSRVIAIALDSNNNELAHASRVMMLAQDQTAQVYLNLVVGGSAAFDLDLGFMTEWRDIRQDNLEDGLNAEFQDSYSDGYNWDFKVTSDTATATVHFEKQYRPEFNGDALTMRVGSTLPTNLGPFDRAWFGIPKSAQYLDSNPLGDWTKVRHYRFNAILPGPNGPVGVVTDRWYAAHDGLIQEQVLGSDLHVIRQMTRVVSTEPSPTDNPSPLEGNAHVNDLSARMTSPGEFFFTFHSDLSPSATFKALIADESGGTIYEIAGFTAPVSGEVEMAYPDIPPGRYHLEVEPEDASASDPWTRSSTFDISDPSQP